MLCAVLEEPGDNKPVLVSELPVADPDPFGSDGVPLAAEDPRIIFYIIESDMIVYLMIQ